MIAYFQVRGQSMEPLCKEGDFVLLDRLSYLVFRPKVGDMVVLRRPEDVRLLLKYIRKEKMEHTRSFYWVEGLNREESSDSRTFGWVSREAILGKALIVPGHRLSFPQEVFCEHPAGDNIKERRKGRIFI